MPLPVIAIFDAGKTNKKLLLFDEQYKLLHEESVRLAEITDEDGFACEDIRALTAWVKDAFNNLRNNPAFDIKAVNCSAYGASFVYLDKQLNAFLPLYNYLKPYDARLQKQFYSAYGGESVIARQTASPVLGSLNSGLQLYRLKYERPDEFSRIERALHLPQYLSFILSSRLCTDITSVGCHTHLWDFERDCYHRWVTEEGLEAKFAPFVDCRYAMPSRQGIPIPVGTGLHDSSAALIPYLASFSEPFILLSTGTWCISLNPFNHIPLSDDELKQDCLCYLTYEGKPVKASRLFAGHEHEQQTKRLATHFSKSPAYYTTVSCDRQILSKFKPVKIRKAGTGSGAIPSSVFASRDLNAFADFEEAYHQLIADLIEQQIEATCLVLKGTAVKKIFVDGGFSQNPIYMHLLAAAFPDIEVYAASVAQASALGAALAIHEHWNSKPLPGNLIELKSYTSSL